MIRMIIGKKKKRMVIGMESKGINTSNLASMHR